VSGVQVTSADAESTAGTVALSSQHGKQPPDRDSVGAKSGDVIAAYCHYRITHHNSETPTITTDNSMNVTQMTIVISFTSEGEKRRAT